MPAAAVWVAAFVAVLAVGPSLAAGGGVVTIAEGKPVGIRALGKYALAEGTRVQADDLLQTGRDGFIQIEFEDGAVVDVGAGSSVEFGLPSQRRGDRPALYLLSGWLKLQAAGSGPARAGLGSPAFDLAEVSGSVVVRVEQDAGAVFVEQGAARFIDRRPHAAGPVALKRNDFLSYRREDAVAAAGRPGADFVGALPRQLRDLLPQRYAAFKGKERPPHGEGPFTYPEVEAWLNAEAPIRRQFVRTWRAKADDMAFRAALDQAMALHPEWDPVLHPEHYEPKPAPDAAASAVASAPNPAPALTGTNPLSEKQ